MRNKRKKRFRVLRTLLLLIMVVCLIPVGQAYYLFLKYEKQQEKIRDLLREGNSVKIEAEIEQEGTQNTEARLIKYQTLYQENNDLAGWLTIAGTEIDYPVMQCGDDEYYLSHSFYKEKDKYGCLYVREIADIHTPGTNFIIYGHNMQDGCMFGNLDKYKEEDYFREHPLISFDTLFEEREYQILASFRSQLAEGDFEYYKFYQADTEKEFMEFYGTVKRLSLYDTGVTAAYGDTFLTLSTCSSHTENGRFVVVAKRGK